MVTTRQNLWKAGKEGVYRVTKGCVWREGEIYYAGAAGERMVTAVAVADYESATGGWGSNGV
jgi:hypothetical protein